MVGADADRLAGGLLAGLSGSLGGLVLNTHHGVPVLLLVIAIAGAICFGLVSSTERIRDRKLRSVKRRLAVTNFGTLWLLSCSAVFALNVTFSIAIVIGLSAGLFGSAALEKLEASDFVTDVVTRIAKWWLERR